MSLSETLQIINDNGAGILKSPNFINLLMDYQAFKDNPSARYLMKLTDFSSIHSEGEPSHDSASIAPLTERKWVLSLCYIDNINFNLLNLTKQQ